MLYIVLVGNPWIAAYTFEVIKANVDQIQSEAA